MHYPKMRTWISILALVSGTWLKAGSYRNPIITGFAPDPSICRVGEDYYLANSSFVMVPGAPIYHSKDLVNWELASYAFPAEEGPFTVAGRGTNSGVWAPTLRYHEGTYYLIVKNQAMRQHILTTASNPRGPWLPAVAIPDWDDGIDPDIFFDADGKVYLTKTIEDGETTRFPCQEYDLAANRLVGEPRYLWNGSIHEFEEGPHLYRIGDYYYIILAEGGTWNHHRATVARRPVREGLGHAPEDWEPSPYNPLLFNDPSVPQEINTTGHADLVQDHAGNWWVVFLCNRRQPQPDLGRETCLAPVEWIDGWPVANKGEYITLNMEGPTLPVVPVPAAPVRDEFQKDSLDLEWNFLREDPKGAWSLTEQPGSLVLRGKEGNLASLEAIAWVGRRLRHKEVRIATQLDFLPAVEGATAGLNIFSRDIDHLEWAVSRRDGRRQLIARKDSDRIIGKWPIDLPGPVRLEAIVQDEMVYLRASLDGGKTWKTYLADAVPNLFGYPGFAGIYVGLHATGNGREVPEPAVFNWFEYEGDPAHMELPRPKPQVVPVYGNERVEAEHATVKEGLQAGRCSEGGSMINGSDPGDYLLFQEVVFTRPVNRVRIRFSTEKPGTILELRRGGPDGPLLASIELPDSGGWQAWDSVEAPVEALSGTMALCVVYRGKSDRLGNINYLEFFTE